MIQKLALEKGGIYETDKKTTMAFNQVLGDKDKISFFTGSGKMRAAVLRDLGFSYTVIGESKEKTKAEDTERLAKLMVADKIELLIFAGGDGTARNIFKAIGLSVPCIGIPAGVKIHSAVYANNPKDAGLVIKAFINDRNTINIEDSEVMDIDEDKFRENIVDAKLYGYLKVPRVQNL